MYMMHMGLCPRLQLSVPEYWTAYSKLRWCCVSSPEASQKGSLRAGGGHVLTPLCARVSAARSTLAAHRPTPRFLGFRPLLPAATLRLSAAHTANWLICLNILYGDVPITALSRRGKGKDEKNGGRNWERETALKKEGFNIFIPGKELSQFITILHCPHPRSTFFLSLSAAHRVVVLQYGKKQWKRTSRAHWAVLITKAHCSYVNIKANSFCTPLQAALCVFR